MDIEKMNEEVDRLRQELSRLEPADPNYRVISENLERMARVIGDVEKRDQDRLNNNARNDISEEGVRVDMAKVKTDRLREWLGVVKTGITTGAGLGMAWLAYKGEVKDFKLPIRGILDAAKSLIPRGR